MTQLLVVRDEDTPPVVLTRARDLVFATFDGRFDDHDWDHGCGGWRIVALDDGVPVSHAAVVHRQLLVGDRPYDAGYVEAVGTAPTRWNQGLGSLVMAATHDVIHEHFAFGALSTSRQSFYERLGWERWQGPSYVLREDGVYDRTADEDDGLMVLRYGASAELDFTASLTCHERPGDDW